MQGILQALDPVFDVTFFLHDRLSEFLTKYFREVKIGLLLIAHLSLFGFLFPEMRKEFGSIARLLLLFILFLSPLSKIFRMRILAQMMSFRRELGIWFAYLATVHGVGYLIDPDWFEFIFDFQATAPFGIQPTFFFGVTAYILTLPLLFTSNNLSVRILKANWKRMQMLAYPVLVFTLLHASLLSRSDAAILTPGTIKALVIAGFYVFLKLLTQRNFLPPLVRLIQYVSDRYRAHQVAI